MRRRSLGVGLALTLVVSFGAAGCSSDKSDGGSASSDTTTTAVAGGHGATTTTESSDDTTGTTAGGGGGGGDYLTNPCVLVTPKQVSDATGGEYGTSELIGSGPALECSYGTTDQTLLPVKVAITDAPDAQTGFDAQKTMQGAEAVEGLGDEAFWFGSAIHVKIGDKTLMVTTLGFADDPKGKAIAIAKDALANI